MKKNNVRLNVIKQIKDSLVICNHSIDLSLYDINMISDKIEDEIYNQSGCDSNAKCYRDKIKEVLLKMKKNEYDYLKQQLLSGDITPKEFLVNQISEIKSNTKDKPPINGNISFCKKAIFSPPKVKLHSRSNSVNYPQEEQKIDTESTESKVVAIKQRETSIPKTCKVKTVVQVMENNNDNSKTITSLSNKIISQGSDNEMKSSMDIGSIALLNESLPEVIIDNEIQSLPHKEEEVKQEIKEKTLNIDFQQVKVDDNNKKSIPLFTKVHSEPQQKRQDMSLLSTNHHKESIDSPPVSLPQKELNRHHSYSDIHSNNSSTKPNQLINLNKKYLELQINNQKTEAKCILYEKELENLRKELNSIKEQNINLSMVNHQLTTELHLKTNTITQLQSQITSQNTIISNYTSNYSNLKTKIENNSTSNKTTMDKLMQNLTQINNKYESSSLSKLQATKTLSKPSSNKPQSNLFTSNDNEMSFASFLNNQ